MSDVYLDHAATTPVDEKVLKAMQPYFGDIFGNPSSVHTFGQRADAALQKARRSMAGTFGCQPKEVIFTSCGSESDNLALRGAALAARDQGKGNHILISGVEHHAVTHTAQQLERLFGFDLECIPVDRYGGVNPDSVAERIRPDTILVSIIHANNEIGTLNPISEISTLCRERDVLIHTDAVQGAAHFPLKMDDLKVDMLSIGAHKFYGPKGVGALYVREGTPLIPVQTGGSQEFGKRAATENLPLIVGMAKALQMVHEEADQRLKNTQKLRDRVISNVLGAIPDSTLTGHPERRLPNHASFAFQGLDGNLLVSALDVEGFACSSGSACKTGNPEPSSVLLSMGFDRGWAKGSLRVTVGKDTHQKDVDVFLDVLPVVVKRLRELT
ncbi:MAG: cysteine desulfurase [Anaerolineales bacterium]|nr:cysteine desulfurase [Anaerolineales bacterium]